MYLLYCCSHETNSMQKSPLQKWQKKTTVIVKRGCFQFHASRTTTDTALEAIQAHQQSRRTAGRAKSQARALPKHCTIQIPASTEARSWTLQYRAKTLPFLLGKNCYPFLLTGRISGFWKRLQPRPNFFPPLVLVLWQMSWHTISCLVFSWPVSGMRQKHVQPWWGKVTCQHNAVVFPTPLITTKYVRNENFIICPAHMLTPTFKTEYLRQIYCLDLQI